MKINLNPAEQKIFESFKQEFLRANDSSIKFTSAKCEKNYIRVDFLRDGKHEWLHVVSPNQWY